MSLIKVKDYLKKYNMEDRVLELNMSSATVSEAAKALNCDEAHIAKTLSFIINNNKPILIVTAGDVKIDNHKYKNIFGCKAKMIDCNDVEKIIGHAVGGVCPFAVNDRVIIYLDESLKRFNYVFPACGSSNSAIKLSIEELEYLSNYKEWINVTKEKEEL